MKLSCPFHALAYQIECHERAALAKKLVHPILKRGHSNAVEASHNVLIRFRSKDISLERLHYHLSTNLGLLQANLTYMHAKFGTNYHWIPELYRRLELPVFDGVQEALDKHSAQRKRVLEKAKSTPAKKRRIAWKVKRTLARKDRINWTKKHGHNTYGCDDGSDLEHDLDIVKEGRKGKTGVRGKPRGVLHVGQAHTNARATKTVLSRDTRVAVSVLRGETNLGLPCLCMKGNQRQTKRAHCQSSDALSDVSCLDDSLSDVCCLGDDDNSLASMCTCGAEGRAHKRGCPMSSRKRYPGRTLFAGWVILCKRFNSF